MIEMNAAILSVQLCVTEQSMITGNRTGADLKNISNSEKIKCLIKAIHSYKITSDQYIIYT